MRGIFLSPPFNLNKEVATILAQLCCHNETLPQGAPTSPIISNFICRSLDNDLLKLARNNKMCYTRYADDLTFSTNLKDIPENIGEVIDDKFYPSDRLRQVIEKNGFFINPEKTRHAYRNNRQEVTGLVVNTKVNVSRKYVRQIRSMLHAWEKFGLDNAANEHFAKYNVKKKIVTNNEWSFKKELLGKINYLGYIKGYDDDIYKRLYSRIVTLDQSVKLVVPSSIQAGKYDALIYCEGKSDVIHLNTALNHFKTQGLYPNLNVWIYDRYNQDKEINNDSLYQACSARHITKQSNRVEIYLFDSDDTRYHIGKVRTVDSFYKSWGNNVFSATLPDIKSRAHNKLCIEFFYYDEDFMKRDEDGRRLYMTSEFDPETGNHFSEQLYYPVRGKLRCSPPQVLDSNVKKISDEKNVALTKLDFAKNIAQRKGNFADVSFDNFKYIFDMFEEILLSVKAPADFQHY